MRKLWGIAFGVVCGFLGAGLLLLATNRPRGESIQLSPPPTRAPLVVHVTGAVVSPGVYFLEYGSRVKDAIAASGGLEIEADASLINLAMPVEDGMQVWVPYKVENIVESGASTIIPGQSTTEIGGGKININTASQGELESLSGIGPVRAKAVIEYRLEHGPFREIEDIQNVSGIGPVTFENIKFFITVTGPSDGQ